MTSPAIRSIKEALDCRITVLTSSMASEVCPLIPEIDEVITATLPWVKAEGVIDNLSFRTLVNHLSSLKFDAAFVFTVYSQSALPSAMMAWMAGIPHRIAQCRENPYNLLTLWVPDYEPFETIKHQVERDLHLVESTGIKISENSIKLTIPEAAIRHLEKKLIDLFKTNPAVKEQGFSGIPEYIVLHPGVSEPKRAYPSDKWIQLARDVIHNTNCNVIFSGSMNDKKLTDFLEKETGNGSISAAGIFSVTELAALISKSKLLISVNTGPVHIAAGLKKPVVVLYAQTNPQHKPWNTESRVFEFTVPESMQSKNGIIRFVNRELYNSPVDFPQPSEIAYAVHSLLNQTANHSASQ